jgi:hypothetical protein
MPTQRVLNLLSLTRNNVRNGVESIDEIKRVFTECMLDFTPEERVFLACAFVDEVSIERFWGEFCYISDDRPRPGALISEWILNGATADGSATPASESSARRSSSQNLAVAKGTIPTPSPN